MNRLTHVVTSPFQGAEVPDGHFGIGAISRIHNPSRSHAGHAEGIQIGGKGKCVTLVCGKYHKSYHLGEMRPCPFQLRPCQEYLISQGARSRVK